MKPLFIHHAQDILALVPLAWVILFLSENTRVTTEVYRGRIFLGVDTRRITSDFISEYLSEFRFTVIRFYTPSFGIRYAGKLAKRDVPEVT